MAVLVINQLMNEMCNSAADRSSIVKQKRRRCVHRQQTSPLPTLMKVVIVTLLVIYYC